MDQQLLSGFPISTAPKDGRDIIVFATRPLFDDRPFCAKAHYDQTLGWVIKDEPPYGWQSLGLLPIDATSWLP